MTERQIIGAIMLATGLTMEDYARDCGYAKSTIYLNINGKLRTPGVREKIVADIAKIKTPIKVTFPPRPKKAA